MLYDNYTTTEQLQYPKHERNVNIGHMYCYRNDLFLVSLNEL